MMIETVNPLEMAAQMTRVGKHLVKRAPPGEANFANNVPAAQSWKTNAGAGRETKPRLEPKSAINA